MPQQLTLPDGYKWLRFFRLQLAVRQTAKNRARLAAGKRPLGRPMPRLVSIDFVDAYMVPAAWTALDAHTYAQTLGVPYYAVFLDGEYHVLPAPDVPAHIVQACLDNGTIVVLPREGLALW